MNTPTLKPIQLNKTYMFTGSLWRYRNEITYDKHVSRTQWKRQNNAFN